MTQPALEPVRSVAPATQAQRVTLVLLAGAAPRMALWTRQLEGERFRVLTPADSDAERLLPDVIVTDQALDSETLARFHEPMIHGEVGVVLIGRNLPADVVLPEDCTRRELRLACRLLSQVVVLRRQQRKLAAQAITDPLTGLANRRAIESHVRDSQSQPQSQARQAVAVFDVDQFKRINAELGYALGDKVLRSAAKALMLKAPSGFTARLGGDEFLLVWPASSLSSAYTCAEELRRAMGAAAGLAAARPVTLSAGVALVADARDLESLVTAADHALRAAKQSGGRKTESAELSSP